VLIPQSIESQGGIHGIPSIARPRADQAHRVGRKDWGSIIIPDTAKEKPMEGEVVAAGPGARGEDGKLQPMDLRSGDRVLFGKWSGTEVKLDGEELIIMKESDVMGVIERDAPARKVA
jgi:chaperonin GroES